MKWNSILGGRQELLKLKRIKWSISMIMVSLMLFSCAPEPKSTIEKPASAKSESAIKKAVKKEITPLSRVSASDVIDHRDVDIHLLSDLIHQEINKVKKANKLPLLKKDKVLKNAATDQNNYQIKLGDLSHTQKSAKKKNIGDRVAYYGGGFKAMAENVMYEGFVVRMTGTKKEIVSPSYAVQAKKMVTSWMNSPGHRKNIMNPRYDKVGTAAGYNADLHAVFATQVFGKKFSD